MKQTNTNKTNYN